MGLEKRMTLLEDLVEKAGGCAVVDGGFATQLESHGAGINDPLWSALCLIKDPDLIKRVHMEYLEAGADILVTSSYQATLPGFVSRELSIEEGESLLKKSVKLAVEARDKFWDAVKRNPIFVDTTKLWLQPPLEVKELILLMAQWALWARCESGKAQGFSLTQIASSCGCRLPCSSRELIKLVKSDLIESFRIKEGRLSKNWYRLLWNQMACVEWLEEENVNIPSWICFCSMDGVNAPSGESFQDCLDVINKSNKVHAVGINCAPPHFIESLIWKFRKLTGKLVVVYPNSDEIWDGRAKKWLPSTCFNDDKFKLFATRWHDLGDSLIGGCCRTTPSTIGAISKALKERD